MSLHIWNFTFRNCQMELAIRKWDHFLNGKKIDRNKSTENGQQKQQKKNWNKCIMYLHMEENGKERKWKSKKNATTYKSSSYMQSEKSDSNTNNSSIQTIIKKKKEKKKRLHVIIIGKTKSNRNLFFFSFFFFATIPDQTLSSYNIVIIPQSSQADFHLLFLCHLCMVGVFTAYVRCSSMDIFLSLSLSLFFLLILLLVFAMRFVFVYIYTYIFHAAHYDSYVPTSIYVASTYAWLI